MTNGPRDYVTEVDPAVELKPSENPVGLIIGLSLAMLALLGLTAVGVRSIWPASKSAKSTAPGIEAELREQLRPWSIATRESFLAFAKWRAEYEKNGWTDQVAAQHLRTLVIQPYEPHLAKLQSGTSPSIRSDPNVVRAIDLGLVWVKHLGELHNALQRGQKNDIRRADTGAVAFVKALAPKQRDTASLKTLASEFLQFAVSALLSEAISGQ